MRKSVGRALFEAAQMGWAQEEALRNPKPPVVTPRQESPEEKSRRQRRELSEAYEREFFARKAKEDAESKAAQEAGERDFLLTQLDASRDEKKILAECPLDKIPQALADERREAPLRARREVIFRSRSATPLERGLLSRTHPDDVEHALMELRRVAIETEFESPSLGMYGVLVSKKT